MKFWIEQHFGSHDGRYDIKCPDCNFSKEIQPNKGEIIPNFCPSCGKKLHVVRKENVTTCIEQHFGNSDGRYNIKCSKCNFSKEIQPKKGEDVPNFCPSCGIKMK
jgi:peptide subunit release factor 1 (eRF1)